MTWGLEHRLRRYSGARRKRSAGDVEARAEQGDQEARQEQAAQGEETFAFPGVMWWNQV